MADSLSEAKLIVRTCNSGTNYSDGLAGIMHEGWREWRNQMI